MVSAIEELINSYNPKTAEESKAILREVIQSIVLIGLSRGGFFEKASFYGGTALRIFYNLNRYSEDLDFTLNDKDNDFSLDDYLLVIKQTALSYGLDMDLSIKEKKFATPIESAFAKLNTYQTLLNFRLNESVINQVHKDEVLRIKFEVDCDPALGFVRENKWLTSPEFCSIVTLDEGSLFAGKLHALLCRNYKNNVKGRDYYDFLFYMKKGIRPNLVYLRNKLIESNKISTNDEFNIEILKKMLLNLFETIDFEEVKKDAMRFIFKKEELDYLTKDLFIEMLNKIESI